jgi:predicted PolB exonuclease-like 3'-5' exonuclease
MAKLVFDIETSALPLDGFDDVQQEYLFRDAERIPDPEQRAARRVELRQMLSLWPLTAQIVCIAMMNAETERGQVLYVAEEADADGDEKAPVKFVACMDEAEMLGTFWEVARHYETAITFNGRTFDVPFLYMRSALLNVPISRKDWLGYRYQFDTHCDLADQFTFYNGGRDGATRRFNLDFYCKAFGIDSPKAKGITGMDIGQLVAQKRFREIADYCLRDVHATVALYKIWRDRLSSC